MSNNFYVQTIGSRFGNNAVAYPTLEAADAIAKLLAAKRDAMRVNVYDCTNGPVGRLVATYNCGGEKLV